MWDTALKFFIPVLRITSPDRLDAQMKTGVLNQDDISFTIPVLATFFLVIPPASSVVLPFAAAVHSPFLCLVSAAVSLDSHARLVNY